MEEILLDLINNLEDKNITVSDFKVIYGDRKELIEFIETLDVDVYSNVLNITSQLYNIQKDKYVRLYAEFENYKKRTRVDISNSNIQVKTDLMSGIFILVDELNLALSNVDSEDIKMLMYKLEKFISEKGYTKIDNEIFNDVYHEAISVVNLPNMDDDKIVSVVSSGYLYDGKVVRYSKVIVNKQK